MKKISLVTALLLTSNAALAFSLSSFTDKLLDAPTNPQTQTQTSQTPKSNSNLSDSVVTDGLKEALKIGVDYGVKELSKKDGYLSNKDVKIPLPQNLAKVEDLVRKAGGEKIADDLIYSMNSAATEAAPKTAVIFIDAVEKMSIDDAKQILAGGDEAATEYFEQKTSTSLANMIKPIVEKSMQENSVAEYYDTFNDFYKNNLKSTVDSSEIGGMAKSFGLDSYLPATSDESLNDYVTQKAISGLFTMIANKESEIRKDPLEQTTSLLKSVFGK